MTTAGVLVLDIVVFSINHPLLQGYEALEMSVLKTQCQDEDDAYIATTSVSESTTEGDEALKLVGRERTARFSEEDNRRVLRKLVSVLIIGRTTRQLTVTM